MQCQVDLAPGEACIGSELSIKMEHGVRGRVLQRSPGTVLSHNRTRLHTLVFVEHAISTRAFIYYLLLKYKRKALVFVFLLAE